MTRLNRSASRLLAVVSVTALMAGCEKEEEITGPVGPGLTPTKAVVTMDKSTILSDGRDSSRWTLQLIRNTQAYTSAYTVNLRTDSHGYFLVAGKREKSISLETNSNGAANLFFYGSSEPGLSTTILWGKGFGLDTARVSVIIGPAYYVLIAFADPVTIAWGQTDTLTASGGQHFPDPPPDSALVRATVLDIDQNPVPGIAVTLYALNNGSPYGSGQYGYWKTAPNRAASSGSGNDGHVVTNVSGEGIDTFYSDVLPFSGAPRDLEIVAFADSSYFGRISATKFLTVKVP